MGMIGEFKDFAMRGNVIDMAVGIVIGGAFGKIVSSFVGDVVMPLVGLLMGGVDLSKYRIPLREAVLAADGTEEAAAVYVDIGVFANVVIDFIIIAFAIFLVVKAMNAAKKKEEKAPAAPPKPSNEEVLLAEIRDALKAGR
jgi:large conductance mechanosensitive channel